MNKILSKFVLKYFRYFATSQLKKNPDAIVIGVTGSSGKTSLRLAIVQILKTHGKVKHSVSANSESGIPLNILGLSPRTYSKWDWLRLMLLAPYQLLTFNENYKYYVVEMGIDSPDEPKNMSYLLKIIRPHVGVVLNANLTHSAGFDHLVKDMSPIRRMEKLIKEIAKEKMQLAKGLSKTGVAIINLDQKEFVQSKKDVIARQITFGKSTKANLRITSVTVGKNGFSMTFTYQGQKHKLLTKEIYPESYGYTFAAAIATAASVGIPPSLSIPSLSLYHSPSGRSQILSCIKDSTIIDSTYNASPTTMLESLKLLKNIAVRNKKIAVVGDMNELGNSTKLAHKNLADWLLAYSDEAILFGEETKEHSLPVLLSKKHPVHHFSKMSDLIKYLRSTVRPNSYVLVKGSQNGIYLERAVEALLSNHSDASKLCRRGTYWDKVRSKAN